MPLGGLTGPWAWVAPAGPFLCPDEAAGAVGVTVDLAPAGVLRLCGKIPPRPRPDEAGHREKNASEEKGWSPNIECSSRSLLPRAGVVRARMGPCLLFGKSLPELSQANPTRRGGGSHGALPSTGAACTPRGSRSLRPSGSWTGLSPGFPGIPETQPRVVRMFRGWIFPCRFVRLFGWFRRSFLICSKKNRTRIDE